MFVATNKLSSRFTYFSKRVGAVSLGWSSNSEKFGRLIGVGAGTGGAESDELDEELEESDGMVDHVVGSPISPELILIVYLDPILVAICEIQKRMVFDWDVFNNTYQMVEFTTW